MAGNQPTTYSRDVGEKLIEFMSKGKTKQEFHAEYGVGIQTMQDWANPNSKYYEPEFAEQLSMAKAKSLAWWIKKGRCNLKTRDFNTTLYALFMANMHRWRSGAGRADESDERARRIEEALGLPPWDVE